MKKTILLSSLFLTLTLPLPAFASETTNSSASAGITPDSVFYPLDKLAENIQLTFTSDGTNKAQLLNQLSQERLSEAKQMADEKKINLATTTMQDYQQTLSGADTQINQAIQSGQDVFQTVNAISDTEKQSQSTIDSILSSLPQKDAKSISSKLTDTLETVQVTQDLVSELDEKADTTKSDSSNEAISQTVLASKVGADALAKAQQAQLNSREILAVQSLADKTGKSFDDVLAIFLQNNKGLGTTAKALNLQPKDVLKAINQDFQNAHKESITKGKDEKTSSPSSPTTNVLSQSDGTKSQPTIKGNTEGKPSEKAGQSENNTHTIAPKSVSHEQEQTAPSTPSGMHPTRPTLPNQGVEKKAEVQPTSHKHSEPNKPVPVTETPKTEVTPTPAQTVIPTVEEQSNGNHSNSQANVSNGEGTGHKK